MIRVLQVYPQLNNAGTEAVIMNLYSNLDRTQVQFDFLIQKTGELDSKVESMGGRIHLIPYISRKDYITKITSFFLKHQEYKIVHAHIHKEIGIVLKAAMSQNIPYRIAHSHNSRPYNIFITKFLRIIPSYMVEKYATHFFACSKKAAIWWFPRKYKQCKILYNAIDIDNFTFLYQNRLKFRKELNVDDNTLIINHIGRFAPQKNQQYIVEIAEDVVKKRPNTLFLLIGNGHQMNEIQQQIESKNLRQHFRILGFRNDISDILSASDLFILPSLYEGLGIVLIEAQSSGLLCIASDRVPIEADLHTDRFISLPLSNKKKWANMIINFEIESYDKRKEYSVQALSSKYDIKQIAEYMQKYYLSYE